MKKQQIFDLSDSGDKFMATGSLAQSGLCAVGIVAGISEDSTLGIAAASVLTAGFLGLASVSANFNPKALKEKIASALKSDEIEK